MAEAAVMRQVFEVEKEDIQGLVSTGYGQWPSAVYVLLKVRDRRQAKHWLAEQLRGRAGAQGASQEPQLNFAFSLAGLKAMGLGQNELDQFPAPFRQGMVDRGHRSRILGDDEESLGYWRWGVDGVLPDILVLLFAKDEPALQSRLRTLVDPNNGLKIELVLGTVLLPEKKEHFGFADGISQPVIRGFDEQRRRQLYRTGHASELNPGEFLLGYTNEFGTITEAENVFGRNGTYLVFRQMEQFVDSFETHFLRAAGGDVGLAEQLKAKAVGRWPSGAPLTLSPDRDDSLKRQANNFGYAEKDADGLGCPIGAHIRRTNPRDSLEKDPATALLRTRRRRLLRRGRPYGPPGGTDERGLHFICLCGDLERQFEFVQQTWLNNPAFATLAGETDPLTGPKACRTDSFTIQQDPVRRRLTGMPRFVRVRGGGYFFLPGIRALTQLAS